jgi:hypothetical protein
MAVSVPKTSQADPYASARNPDGSRDERLVGLMQRAEHIAQTSGRAPMNWADFRDQIEVKSLGSAAEVTSGLALSVVTGVMIGVVGVALSLNPVLVTALAVGGAVVGGSAGRKQAVYDVEKHGHLVDRYEQYLNGCEHMADKGHTMLHGTELPLQPKADHVARLQEQQQKAQGNVHTLH